MVRRVVAWALLVGVSAPVWADPPSQRTSEQPAVSPLGRFVGAGEDLRVGGFAATVVVAAGADDRVSVRHGMTYRDGRSLELTGEGTRRGRSVRAFLRAPRGAAGGLLGGESQPLVAFELEVDAAGQRWRSRCLVDGRAVAAAHGRTEQARAGAQTVPKFSRERAEGTTTFLGVPFVEGKGDGREVHPNDPRQGGLGDCWLIAGMIAVAHTDPDRIRELITDHGDGTYSVKLYDVGWFYRDATVRVDRELPYVTRGSQRLPAFAKLGDQRREGAQVLYELWPAMIEKAYAEYEGGYAELVGGSPTTTFEFLSGESASRFRPVWAVQTRLILQAALRKGNPVCIATKGTIKEKLELDYGLVGNHAYVVMGERDGGFVIHNPWGFRHASRPLTADELQEVVERIYVGRF